MGRCLALIALVVAGAAAPAAAADYNFDTNHTQAEFSVVHLGFSHVRGLIPVTGGTLSAGSSELPTAIAATLNAAGIDTKSADRDNDLRGPDWFDVTKYPTITFVSTRVEGTNPSAFTIIGNLTLHGVTKSVTLAAKVEGRMVDARSRTHVAYSATTTIDRRDFNLNFGKTVPGGALIAGFEIPISLTVEAISK